MIIEFNVLMDVMYHLNLILMMTNFLIQVFYLKDSTPYYNLFSLIEIILLS